MILPIMLPLIAATVVTGNASAVSQVTTSVSGGNSSVNTTITTSVNGITQTVKSTSEGTIRVEASSGGIVVTESTTSPSTIAHTPPAPPSSVPQAQNLNGTAHKLSFYMSLTEQLNTVVSHFWNFFRNLIHKPS